jgi:hypothetical protein
VPIRLFFFFESILSQSRKKKSGFARDDASHNAMARRGSGAQITLKNGIAPRARRTGRPIFPRTITREMVRVWFSDKSSQFAIQIVKDLERDGLRSVGGSDQ